MKTNRRLKNQSVSRQLEQFARKRIERRTFIKAAAALAVGAGLPKLSHAADKPHADRLFPTDLPSADWVQFPAAGFSQPACGVIYRLKDTVTNGMALGGVDTGCFDLETSGMMGFNTIYNTLVPRRGPVNLPLLGFSVQGKTWVLCDPKQLKKGWGEYQYPEGGQKIDYLAGSGIHQHR